MSEIALKPCPFCGAESVHQEPLPDFGTRRDERWAATYCNDCHARAVGRGVDKQGAYADAARRWNRRHERTCHDTAENIGFSVVRTFTCSECGETANIVRRSPSFCPSCGARVVEE